MINMNQTNKKGEISSADSRPECTASKDRPLKSPLFESPPSDNSSQGLHHQKPMERKKPLKPKELMEEYEK